MIRTKVSENAPGLTWFKNSYRSGSEVDSCVEIATEPGTVHVRDSRNVHGPRLAFPATVWAQVRPYAATA
jgi:hypothetical protein